MNAATTQHEWTKYLRFFAEQNAGRPTRLGVFEHDGNILNDYWLEDGLPLSVFISIQKRNGRGWMNCRQFHARGQRCGEAFVPLQPDR